MVILRLAVWCSSQLRSSRIWRTAVSSGVAWRGVAEVDGSSCEDKEEERIVFQLREK